MLYSALNSMNNKVVTMIYFILWIFLGNYVLLNLFLAVLLDGFSVNADEQELKTPDELWLSKEQTPENPNQPMIEESPN